tara:strand:+ start:876 stop:1115 length:240 start_codon:yes stop_codon:yes gene_type:complete
MNDNEILTLSDDVISQIAKLVQMAILTGTDVVDNLRTLQLTVENNQIFCSPDYREVFTNNLNSMLGDIPNKQAEGIKLQ